MARFHVSFSKIIIFSEQDYTNKIFYCIGFWKTEPTKTNKTANIFKSIKKHISEIKIYYGHFLTHEVSAPIAKPVDNKKTVKIIKTEEKGSDVNIAVHLLNDAWLDNYDCAVIVSNDSDLAESMRLVRQYHQKKIIGLIMPGKGHPSKELMKYAHFIKRIRTGILEKSQLPNPIPNTNIYKPKDW